MISYNKTRLPSSHIWRLWPSCTCRFASLRTTTLVASSIVMATPKTIRCLISAFQVARSSF